MVSGIIRDRLANFGQTLYRAFTDPIVGLFKALFGYPTVTEYGKIPSTVDHKLATTYSELEAAIQARAWLSLLFNREATVDQAANNVSLALIDLKKSLARTALDGETARALVEARVDYIRNALFYAESNELTERQRESIVRGIKSLEGYHVYLDIWERQAFKRIAGIEDLPEKAPFSQVDALKQFADKQGLRLEEIAKDIESGSTNASILQESALEITRNLREDVLPQLERQIDQKEYRGFIDYLSEIERKISPPSFLERYGSWLNEPPTRKITNEIHEV